MQERKNNMVKRKNPFIRMAVLLIPMIVTFAAAGMFVGIVGSWTSIRKFMDV